nr:transposase [Pseudomonas baetica]
MLTAFQRGEFSNADAFIVFPGMDLRASKSGLKDGRRSLTKRGDPRGPLDFAQTQRCRLAVR